jgi:hypothetical protein
MTVKYISMLQGVFESMCTLACNEARERSKDWRNSEEYPEARNLTVPSSERAKCTVCVEPEPEFLKILKCNSAESVSV